MPKFLTATEAPPTYLSAIAQIDNTHEFTVLEAP